jgi:hypothetical protein
MINLFRTSTTLELEAQEAMLIMIISTAMGTIMLLTAMITTLTAMVTGTITITNTISSKSQSKREPTSKFPLSMTLMKSCQSHPSLMRDSFNGFQLNGKWTETMFSAMTSQTSMLSITGSKANHCNL